MSQHRRLNPTIRAPRRKRVPAYQVRHRPGLPSDLDSRTRQSNETVVGESATDDISRWSPRAPSSDTESFLHFDSQHGNDDARSDQDSLSDAGTDDYASYVRSVEEAAARSRSVTQSGALDSAPPVPEARVPLRGDSRRNNGRPASAPSSGGAPPRSRSRTRNGRADREPDPRPLLRRPKTWFVIVAMLFAVSALIVVMWTLNLAKATYDAYNEMHVEPTPRTVFQVNSDGTPVPVPTEEVAAALPNWESGDPFNILLLGVDDRDGEDEPIRSDTMIIVRVDPTARTVAMMSIPRDLLVYIPGFRNDKINAAYPLGEYYEVPGGGAALAAQTLEANFNIPIHYFITVDFTGFRKIVDTIGGIIVDVPAPVKDDQYPTETYGLTRIYFPTGLQRMDGATALRYTRTRHGDNDIARGERQQQILLAIRSQALNLGLITRAESLIRDTGDSVRTDLNFNQLLALANLGRGIESENIYRINLWEEGLIFEHWPVDEDDAFYFDADWYGIWAVVDEFFRVPGSGESPTAGVDITPITGPDATAGVDDVVAPDLRVPVIVQNASTTDLIATSAARILITAGFSDVTPANALLVEEVSTIYDYSGSPATAAHVARQLGIDRSHIVPGSDGEGIVIVLGEDYAASTTR
jgi:polyisoprenyl-teichoic acid--peptidoglycan teichoic acid transferase